MNTLILAGQHIQMWSFVYLKIQMFYFFPQYIRNLLLLYC